MTQISPMLAVANGTDAIRFYQAAFGAVLHWEIEGGQVAGLSIDGADFFLAEESPEYGTRSPSSVGFTTVRIELFVDDPVAVHRQAMEAGATLGDAVQEHHYPNVGPRPIGRMLQGSVIDPSGHKWLIGKFLD